MRDDPGCIEGVVAIDAPVVEKQSLVQMYSFDPSQEGKLAAGDKTKVIFTHNLEAKFSLVALDAGKGELKLKLGKKALTEKFGGAFPKVGSLLQDEFVPPGEIPDALAAVAEGELSNTLHPPVGTPIHLAGFTAQWNEQAFIGDTTDFGQLLQPSPCQTIRNIIFEDIAREGQGCKKIPLDSR